MGANLLKENLDKAKELRRNMTPQERKLWKVLRNHQFYGLEIRRQYPIDKYVVDFICRSKKIIIEIISRFYQGTSSTSGLDAAKPASTATSTISTEGAT